MAEHKVEYRPGLTEDQKASLAKLSQRKTALSDFDKGVLDNFQRVATGDDLATVEKLRGTK